MLLICSRSLSLCGLLLYPTLRWYVSQLENKSNPCLLNNLELDYESMEKAEIKFIDDYLKDLEEGDR